MFNELAESEQGRIKELLMDKKVFLVVDKSEIDKKKYLNVLVGDINVPEKTYLLDCSVVKPVNQNIRCAKIDVCLRNLDIPRENFVLLLSDAASYMTARTAALKVLYPYLFHVTCTAHMLPQLCRKSPQLVYGS